MGYKGNDEDKNHGSMAHYNDLREIYAKHMEYHGCGFGLFQPISARDMTPPCAGYFDRNGDWNLIARLSTSPQAQKPLHTPGSAPAQPYAPLKYEPTRSSTINIEWQPKTSQDVAAHVLGAGGQTPDNLPAGADVKIKYASNSKFGAVLMTLRPISLTAYNDERLFMDWINNNRALLSSTYGPELKKYGFWLVTRTYTAPGCSINAWQDNSKQTEVSLKAKANMLGELADGELEWNDKMTDKDWSHYKANDGDGLVVFMDGIEVPKTEWWIESFRQKLVRAPNRSHSSSPDRPVYYDPNTVLPPQIGDAITTPNRKSPLGSSRTPRGYLLPPDHAENTYDYFGGSGAQTARVDIGVMPTWSENTAGPVTHGGTQNIIPKNDGSGGYLIANPNLKQPAQRTDSGFASLFTKMPSPAPWEGIESPVLKQKQAPAAAAPAAATPAPQATSTTPATKHEDAAAAATSAPNTPETKHGSDTPGSKQGPTTPVAKQGEQSPAVQPESPPWQIGGAGWSIDFNLPVDEETLKDAGMNHLNRRSLSVRRPSNASSIRPPSIADSLRSTNSMGRSKSLRREVRSISGDSMIERRPSAPPQAGYAAKVADHKRQSSVA